MNLKDKKRKLLEDAQAITLKAIQENRPMRDEEKELVNGMMIQVDKIKSDLDLIDQAAKMEAQANMKMAGKNTGQWNSQFLKELDKYPKSYLAGKKALFPVAGSVTVGSMSNTIGNVEDVAETILQIIPVENTAMDKISYIRETLRTHAAAAVPVKKTKPTSTYNLERVNEDISTIAHLSDPIPRQWLEDAPMLSSYLTNTMHEGLLLEIERQIFGGDGADDEFTGIANTSGVLGQSFSTDILTTTRKAITALELLPIKPDYWAIHPNDWEDFELEENTAGFYAMGLPGAVPVDRANRKLWGLPVLVTPGVTENICYLGAFKTALKLWEREGVRIDWSETFHTTDDGSDVTGFETNQVRFRCEGRYALEISRPGAIVEVSLTAS